MKISYLSMRIQCAIHTDIHLCKYLTVHKYPTTSPLVSNARSCHSSLLHIFRQNQVIKSALCPLPSVPISPSIILELWRSEQKYPQLNTSRTQGGHLVHLHSLKCIHTQKKKLFVSGRTALLINRTTVPLGGFTASICTEQLLSNHTHQNLARFKSWGREGHRSGDAKERHNKKHCRRRKAPRQCKIRYRAPGGS